MDGGGMAGLNDIHMLLCKSEAHFQVVKKFSRCAGIIGDSPHFVET